MRIGLHKTSDDNPVAILFKLARLQAVSAVMIGLIVYLCFDAYQAVSALLGGVTAAAANFYLGVKTKLAAGRAHTPQSADEQSGDQQQATELLQQFYRFELGKVVFTLAMLAICIVVLRVSILAYIIAYLITALIINWFALLVIGAADQQQS